MDTASEGPDKLYGLMTAIREEDGPLIEAGVDSVIAAGSWRGEYRGVQISFLTESCGDDTRIYSQRVGRWLGERSWELMGEDESSWPETIEGVVVWSLGIVRREETVDHTIPSSEEAETARQQVLAEIEGRRRRTK